MSDGPEKNAHNALIGAMVADAAALGLHWLYDQARILEVAPKAPVFRKPDAADFDGFKGYFAHGGKAVGDLSQYGQQALLMARVLEANGGAYDQAAYQDAFNSHFGYGGAYVGYIDGATRNTLNNIAADRSDADGFFGDEDVQMPAVAKLPALVGRYAGKAELAAHVASAVRVTNSNETSVAYGKVVSAVLEAAVLGQSLSDALAAGVQAAGADQKAGLEAALASELGSSEFAAEVGMACYLKDAVPVSFHIMKNTTSYAEAVEANIYAGGDSCGRSIFIGSVLGAVYGRGGSNGVPEDWVSKLPDARGLS